MSGPGVAAETPNDALLCYNKGCGQRFLAGDNPSDSCLFHPGYPIFHDALKGWSCCRKRTTDFSEFLAIQGCTKGPHSNEKPIEPLKPEISGGNNLCDGPAPCAEIIVRGPKSAEKMLKERPSTQEEMKPLQLKVSHSLEQELEKMTLSEKTDNQEKEEATVVAAVGTRCKRSGCKEMYEGEESEAGICVYHPGAPVFHEGMKYWSCCCNKTSDFSEFLDQRGCSNGRHLWVMPPGKQEVSCRYDWHQTASLVVITVYAKTSIPDLTKIHANRTQLDIHIAFQKEKEFQKNLELWGVIDVEKSFVNLLPTKVEITLKKADPVTWGRLEMTVLNPQIPVEAEPELIPQEGADEESDGSLSWSEDEELE
ncbi:cysteine and histidine-rich domain-containing protein 1-like [Mantella aurantiaca]